MENAYSERRKHSRHPTPEQAFVIFQAILGRVIDISKGGMAINIIDNFELLSGRWEAIFFSVAENTEITGLPLRLVRTENAKLSKFCISTRTIGVAFDNPNAFHQEQIWRYIGGVS